MSPATRSGCGSSAPSTAYSTEDPFQWGGGWIFGWSGVTFDIDPTQPFGSRGINVMVRRQETGTFEPLVEGEPDCTANPGDPACYSIAGYWFPEVPNRIAAFRNAVNVEVLSGEGIVEPANVVTVKSPAEVVGDYLPDGSSTFVGTGRVNLLAPFPPPVFGNPEMQPLRGLPGVN